MTALAADVIGARPFIGALDELLRLRRDVRRFDTVAVDEALIAEIVGATRYAPSVGLSEPLRLVRLASEDIRQAVRENFEMANRRALAGYDGAMAEKYAGLKLAGLAEAPVQFAVYCDEGTTKGHGLGSSTLPQTKACSCACAIMVMWLAAAARGLGLGWVTIFEAEALSEALSVAPEWAFMGCICIGRPLEQHYDPELERAGWEMRRGQGPIIVAR
jgi:5,6-dimethylbenzimidazole synthase